MERQATASTATTPPTSRCSSPSRPGSRRASSPGSSPRGSRACRASRRRGGGSRVPQHRVDAAAPGEVAGDDRRPPARRTAARTPARQRINIEFVSANPTGPVTSAAPGGRRSATRWPGCSRRRRRRDPRVLLQRPRRPDRPVRRSLLARGARASRRPRTATAASTSPRSPQPSLAIAARASLRPADDEAQEVFRADGVALMFDEIKRDAARLRRRLRRVLPRERPARVRRRRPRRSSGCASTATSTRRTARSGCAPPTSATTRTA